MVVVIDDLHLLVAEASHAVVQQFIEHAPSALRLVLLTRVDPPFPLARLRVAGSLRELRESDLRFTTEETAAFFDHALPGGLERSLSELLCDKAEGWAVGLRLAAIALDGSPNRRDAVHAFAGTHRLVVEYLLEEALNRQRPELQRFLLESAVFRRFTARACAEVVGITNAAALLAEAEHAHLFLIPLDEERQWFRYHHLFGELLAYRLQQIDPMRACELGQLASEWFAHHGDVHEALRIAATLPDDATLVALLDAHGHTLVARSETATLERSMARVREPTSRPEPLFLVALAWLRLLTARAPELPTLLSAIERAVSSPPANYPPERLDEAKLQLELLRIQALRFDSHLEEAITAGQSLLERMPLERSRARAVVLHNVACARQRLGQTRRSLACFERSYDESLRSQLWYVVLSSLGNGGAMQAQLHGVTVGRNALAVSVAFAEQQRVDSLPAFGIVLQQLGHVCIAADALDDAHAALHGAVALGSSGFDPNVRGNAIVLLAQLQALRGRFDEAKSLLESVAVSARAERIGLLETSLTIEHARLALRSGDPAGALAMLTSEATPVTVWTTDREQAALVTLHCLLRLDRRDEARALAEQLAAECAAHERGITLTACQSALALLDSNRSSRVEAVDALLLRVVERGDKRAVLDFGDGMRALLRATVSQLPSPTARELAYGLLSRLNASTQSRTPRSVAALGLIDPLSDRELEVLRLLERGSANKVIASVMCVSIDTVKTHLKHAFAKLDVNGRRDAVERMVSLGLDSDSPANHPM